ncbi:MAG TPA: SpoIIE family protein phosphatase [bacterium]|jgi:sigma-B regulation protein RsbU (phosphoserine phosphatase)
MAVIDSLREQLLERRTRLEAAMPLLKDPAPVVHLLQEVDAALERMENGTYGVCMVCQGHIEKELLLANPLVRVCLEDLNAAQQRALEEDLDLASRLQAALLPQNNLALHGWEMHYHYAPAGPVGGDYWDMFPAQQGDGELLFVLGDVSGKGVAASLLATQLHAIFHSLLPFGLGPSDLVTRANRLLCESSFNSHYATLICGKADGTGNVEICNAGHPPALLLSPQSVQHLDATGVPAGLFCDTPFDVTTVTLQPGDTLLMFTDGLTEAMDGQAEYGLERLSNLIAALHELTPKDLVTSCLSDLTGFLAGREPVDDLTLVAIRKI